MIGLDLRKGLILAILLLINFGAMGWLFYSNSGLKKDRDSWKQNYEVQITGARETIQSKEITIKQAQKENLQLDSILKSKGIKDRQVRYIHDVKWRDTGSVRLKVDTLFVFEGNELPVVGASYQGKCYNASWEYDPNSGESTHNYEIITDLSTIGYWTRANSFHIGRWELFRFGPKESFITVINKCDSSEWLKNEHIEIKKR